MAIEGKGFYLWQIRNCEKGDVDAIVETAVNAGLSHVLIKIADGIYSYNYNYTTKVDSAKPVVDALKEAGLTVWGWHYVYGIKPIEEARIAIKRVQELGLDGYAIDAEAEYKDLEKKTAASKYMTELRNELKSLPIALSSYRFPSYHTRLPWKEFLSQCDFNMPQVYWVKSHNPGEQLQRCLREFQEITPYRPIIPTGSAYSDSTWAVTSGDILEFMQTAQRLQLAAVNFWSWDYCRANLPNIWNTVSLFPWSEEETPATPAQSLIQYLNQTDIDGIVGLYDETAVHITAERTIQGLDAIRTWYRTLLNETLPQGLFTLTGTSAMTGNSVHFTWTAEGKNKAILDGKDTLGMIDGKITYHYTAFTITSTASASIDVLPESEG